ncbi:MAG: MmgE/PrpD family protein, partial [Clostridia bacterium]|nr:MmgE/PrpD family protein [Clostridia bacterium]
MSQNENILHANGAEITSRIVRYVSDLRFEDLTEAAIEQTRMFIADYFAACFAGYRINVELNDKVLQLMNRMGGCAESTVLFSGQKLPAGNAAFLNAVYAHGADMDDGNRKAAGHIGAHVMSAVFAVAETVRASWKDVFTAIVAGYEVFNRVAGAAQPGLYNKGFHSTGVGGAPACAAACAKLLGLDYDGIYNAVSLAAIQSSGLIIIDESGQCCKPINPANAARTGVISAQLAQLGLESSRNPLESRKGWFNAFSNAIDEEVFFEGLG